MTEEKPCILYIEDDPASRMLVDRTLRYAGYRVLVAERGLEGIDMARTQHPDLILTDINLPDITGRELTTMLRSDTAFSTTPIVALTASGQGEQRELAIAAGLTGYLTKPLDVEALPGQLEYYLQGGKDVIDNQRLSMAQTRYTQELVGRLESRIRELEARNQDLLRLDQMKDTFIQLTAHELRTPLTLVYGYSRLLQDNASLKQWLQSDPGTGTLIDGLVEAIQRMQGIINEIITISRIMTKQIDLSIGPLNPASAMQMILVDYEDTITTRQLQVSFDAKQWPKTIRADSDKLELVFSNLVSNAIKYTPDGGQIDIRANTDEQNLYIHIKDTGIGIDPDEQEFIFERFHTAQDTQFHSTSKTAFAGGGLGLGLALCKGVVEAHGGRIEVSSPGRDVESLPGSEFIVVLPLSARKPSQDT